MDMQAIDIAVVREFAMQAHGRQWYGTHPYGVHLDAVSSLLAPYGRIAQAIGLLHDTLEDTATTQDDLCAQFGPFIADAVALLTHPPGTSRKERIAATYARLASVDDHFAVVLVVKVADRLANVRACLADGNTRLLSMYRTEHCVFRTAVHRPGLCDAMWMELDQLLA